MSFLNGTLVVPGDLSATLHFCAEHFVSLCQQAIRDHGFFAVALAGGSTPRAIYEIVCRAPYSQEIEWDKLHLFWSDERPVPPTHSESNYRMAMKAGFEKMPIPLHHIHRMVAEESIQFHAKQYEKTLLEVVADRSLDLVMLGAGEDGHTASLFPDTKGLQSEGHRVVAHHVPQKNSWRMTLSFEAINDALHRVFYVMGAVKAPLVATVFRSSPQLPCQRVGTPDHPALWIVDTAAASMLTS